MADQARASHILLMYAGSARSSATRSKAEALEQIKSLKGDIEGGADFGALAKEHSDCPSGQEGGDLLLMDPQRLDRGRPGADQVAHGLVPLVRHPDRASSPARSSLASATASRRLVLTRSPGFLGIGDGATTVHSNPGPAMSL